MVLNFNDANDGPKRRKIFKNNEKTSYLSSNPPRLSISDMYISFFELQNILEDWNYKAHLLCEAGPSGTGVGPMVLVLLAAR